MDIRCRSHEVSSPQVGNSAAHVTPLAEFETSAAKEIKQKAGNGITQL